MYIVLGASGHVGSALTQALLDRGEPVTAVLRDAAKARDWQAKGAETAVVDVHDVDALRRVLRRGRRAFLLNPPAPPSSDTSVEERKSVAAIVAAVQGSGLERVVAESVYGAQPNDGRGDGIGDLDVLYELEQGLAAQPIPVSIIRAAYYMSNWDASLKTAQEEGVVHTLYPVDFQLPMVAPHDLGQAAARLITEPAQSTGIHYVEGPARYSSADVAAAFARALGTPVRAETTPRDQWPTALAAMGFSEPATRSFVRMTEVTLASAQMPSAPERGATSLQDYVDQLMGGATSA